jgi:hypothetical protein
MDIFNCLKICNVTYHCGTRKKVYVHKKKETFYLPDQAILSSLDYFCKHKEFHRHENS